MQDKGVIIAADLHEDRLRRLRENAARMNLSCLQVVQADAAAPAGAAIRAHAPFDRILLDVPCSNTGVLNRRPDARWRFAPEKLETLTRLQAAMLDAATALLADDGSLVYSTCSLEAEENQQLVERWLAANPAFRMDEQRTSLPPDSGMDGAFAARIKRS